MHKISKIEKIIVLVWVFWDHTGYQYQHEFRVGTLAFTLKRILRQKKSYENSNISPSKNIIINKNPRIETKILQDSITL
jgi:hypothetical protein